MPATRKNNSSAQRFDPYDQAENPRTKDKDASAVSESAAESMEVDGGQAASQQDAPPPADDAALNAALAQATPKPPPQKPRFLPFSTLSKEVLLQCLSLGDVRELERGSKICFAQFNVNKYCELMGMPPGSVDLHSSGSNNLTTMTPLQKMPFGISNTFTDENTGRPKWTVSFSFYNPDNAAEVAAFQQWLSTEFKDAITDLLVSKAREFGEQYEPDEELKMIKRDMMKNYSSCVKPPKKAEYSPQANIKIKSMKDSDTPIIKVWDQKTETKVPYANVRSGDFGQALLYFEGIVKVGNTYYERWFTRELIYCDPTTQQEIATAEDEYPLTVNMSNFAAAAQAPAAAPQPASPAAFVGGQ